MGKWTLGSYDDILQGKMKSLVTSTVNRMNLEDTKPSISYEAFVEELDVCDSFTSTVLDILVKEIADRRTRPSAVDRRLISQHTAESLRMQAAPRHIYRQDRPFSRPSYRIPPSSMFSFVSTLSDEEEGADQLEPPEGVRLNTELYQAYEPPTFETEASREPQWRADRSPETATSPRPRPTSPPPYLSNSRASLPSRSGSSLTRQNTLRRRTSEFTEHAIRRRSAARLYNEGSSSPAQSEEPAEGPSRSSTQDRSEPEGSVLPRRRPRRFFPLTAWSDPHLRVDAADGPAERATTLLQPPVIPPPNGQSSAQLWYTLTGTSPTSLSHDLAVLERAMLPSRHEEMSASEFLLQDSLSNTNPPSPLHSLPAEPPNRRDRQDVLSNRIDGTSQANPPDSIGDAGEPLTLDSVSRTVQR